MHRDAWVPNGSVEPAAYGPWWAVRWPCGCSCHWMDGKAPVGVTHCAGHVNASPMVPVAVIGQFSGVERARHVGDFFAPGAGSRYPDWLRGRVTFEARRLLDRTCEKATRVARILGDGTLETLAENWDTSD